MGLPRSGHNLATKQQHTATKTQCSQIHKYFLKNKHKKHRPGYQKGSQLVREKRSTGKQVGEGAELCRAWWESRGGVSNMPWARREG